MQLQQLTDGIFTIEYFLDESDCSYLIALSESLRYTPADVDVNGQRQMLSMVRTNERVDMKSPELAEKFWRKLKDVDLTPIDVTQPSGLNPFFRFYRYDSDQKFNMHKDGSKEHDGNHSRFTMLIYLNSLDRSGATRFRKDNIEVQPKAGTILLFQHELWHAGMPVHNGVKYVLRTDLLFTSTGSQA